MIAVGLGSCLAGIGIALAAAPALREHDAPAYGISPIDPRPVLVPWVERQVTVDARDREAWTTFDFSRGSVVTDAVVDGHNWDLAFQRYRVATNSGTTNPNGRAGAIKVGPRRPKRASADGYRVDEWEEQLTLNRVFHRWYRYSPMANGLVPRGDYYVLRTADLGYAWLRFVSYYCPSREGGGAGCVTFRYGYRSDFARELRP
jgi:hypothetical protein